MSEHLHAPNHTHPEEASTSLYDSLSEIWGVNIVRPVPADALTSLKKAYEGDDDDFSILLDDIATDFLSTNNADFQNNIKSMRSTKNPDEQQNIKDKQLNLYAQAQNVILDVAGIPQEASKNSLEHSRDLIRSKLIDRQTDRGSPKL